MKRILDFGLWILGCNLKSKIKNPKFLSLVILCCVAFSLPVAACPGCKEALFDPGKLSEKLATSKAYAISIGLMLAMPFLLVGTIALKIVRARTRR